MINLHQIVQRKIKIYGGWGSSGYSGTVKVAFAATNPSTSVGLNSYSF